MAFNQRLKRKTGHPNQHELYATIRKKGCRVLSSDQSTSEVDVTERIGYASVT